MAVKIKLKRLGKIREPHYRIVVADARTKRDGRSIEEIGRYYPKADPSLIEVNAERAQHWLSVGAQPTDPVRKLLEVTGDWQRFKGLPGAEGTLRTAAPRQDRKELFAAAVAETAADTAAAPKGKAKARAADASAADAKADGSQDKPAKSARPAKAKAAEAKPTEVKATGAKPAGAKPAEAKATEAKPAEAKASKSGESAAAGAEPGSGA